MLSIGMFTYSTKPRGSVVHAACLAEALTRAGHEVTLYALAKAGASFYRPVACPVELIVAGEAPSDKAALIKQRVHELCRGLRARAPGHDVFHAQDCLAASALFEFGPAARRRVARTVHHVDRFDDPYLASCQRRSILEASAVFTVSKMTQREVRDQFGRESALIHNGVDAKRFAPKGSPAAAAIRTKYGVGPDAPLIVTVGGVEPRKNTRRCLAAIARVHATCPRLAWVIVGGESIWDHSEYRAAFDADLAALPASLSNRIVQTGAISEPELMGLYAASDILLGASLHEGFGLSVLEAMAAGTSVIVPGRAPFTEYLDERSAAKVDPESIDSIAAAIAELVKSPERRAVLSTSAAKVTARFSWDASAALHVPHYETMRLAEGKGLGPRDREKGPIMPEMHFIVEWPSGETARCYCPSYIIEEYLSVGQEYPVDDFLERVGTSLRIASERVRARYGVACSSALDQLAEIEQMGRSLSGDHRRGPVRVIAFEKHPPRDARRTALRSGDGQ